MKSLSPIITTQENVKKAMQETDYYKEESTRKTNIVQIPLIFRATNNQPLLEWLKKPKELIDAIYDLKQTHGANKGNAYSLTGISRILGAILAIAKFMNLPITKEKDKVLFEGYRISKLGYDLEQYKTKHPVLNKETSVKSYDIIVDNISKKYGKKSLHYLITTLYNFAPLRNDYSNMILVDSIEDIEPDKNYMILPPKGNAQILIQKHKTKNTSGSIDFTFQSTETTLIRKYIKDNKINIGSRLFNDLKPVILEITQDKTDKNDGGTRLLRRSSASTLYNKWVNNKALVDDIYEQIKLMGHSSVTHFKDYIYSV